MREMLILLHDVGRLPPSWQPQVESLPPELPMAAPWIAGLRPGSEQAFDLDAAAQGTSDLLTERGVDRAFVCAHGLSCLVATLAASRDDRIAGLVLTLPNLPLTKRQAKMAKFTMRFMPKSLLGVDRTVMASVLDAFVDLDTTSVLGQVHAPALVIAGDGDRASTDAAAFFTKHLRVAHQVSVPTEPQHEGIPAAVSGVLGEILQTWRFPDAASE